MSHSQTYYPDCGAPRATLDVTWKGTGSYYKFHIGGALVANCDALDQLPQSEQEIMALIRESHMTREQFDEERYNMLLQLHSRHGAECLIAALKEIEAFSKRYHLLDSALWEYERQLKA